MNLMFRKNFREGAKTGRAAGNSKLNSKALNSRQQAKRSQDMGYTEVDFDVQYRTHIFFGASRTALGTDCEEPRCGPVTGSAITLPLQPGTDVDAPQPLVDRRPSMSLSKWSNYRQRKDGSTTARPVTLNGNAASTRSEPVSLTALDRDCFIIPVHSLDRFLPAGIPFPTIDPKTEKEGEILRPLSVLEVSDPKLVILAHLMSPLEAIDPLLESPLAQPLQKQRTVATELVMEVQQACTAVGGMLLSNMERNADFPFIAYYVINTISTDPTSFYSAIRGSSLSKFEPKNLRYTAAHTLDLYCEVASICRPPLHNDGGCLKKSLTPNTAFIISVYKVFEGDDGERFEKNWLYWTGARMLYRYLPRSVGMRRIVLHKSISTKGDKMYLLICECSELLKGISSAAVVISALRARLCGYTGIYRPIQCF